MPGGMVWAEVQGTIVHETAAAVRVEGSSTQVWLPKKEITKYTYREGGDSTAIKVDQYVTHVRIPRWLAEKKDLDYEE